ncbi:MAG: hypothetical protein ACRC6M_15035, partial [Microcystaceae cyanobacterium]
TALMLSCVGVPVILHGADTMPTKYGLSLLSIFKALGLDLEPLSLPQRESLLSTHYFTFYHTPSHFPQSRLLNDYRDQIGKRPPLATLDMIWSPYAGESHQIIGYVHPPTETMIREAFDTRGQNRFTLVKGLEGSCDLRLSQTNIISVPDPTQAGMNYLKLNPQQYGFGGKEVVLESNEHYFQALQNLLNNQVSELYPPAIWNGGFYLWHCGVCASMETGLQQAEQLLSSGQVKQKWTAIADFVLAL